MYGAKPDEIAERAFLVSGGNGNRQHKGYLAGELAQVRCNPERKECLTIPTETDRVDPSEDPTCSFSCHPLVKSVHNRKCVVVVCSFLPSVSPRKTEENRNTLQY